MSIQKAYTRMLKERKKYIKQQSDRLKDLCKTLGVPYDRTNRN